MSNCSHEAWDFGALQCPDCGAVKGHVADADYAKLEAEARALRQQVADRSILVVPERMVKTEQSSDEYDMCADHWNACLDELARLNGKTVSEGLLRRLTADPDYEEVFTMDRGEALTELLDLLNQDKENGNG
ncbi:hypothetical protein [Pseudomonas aeruginosa]|uniref:hypothetical protein n=1 Tax=Pseudomonas aeruginosa TaxID=287 RepID=UPI0015E6AE8D|nr:hypothetical protein [Pseudomonas aeruginosa]